MSSEEHTANVAESENLSIKKGMWFFLFSELIIFGGMLLIYAVNKHSHQFEFKLASKELNSFLGAFDTIIIISGSLTIALAVSAIQKVKKSLSVFLQMITLFMSFGFLVNKFFEISLYNSKGIIPGGAALLEKSPGENLFFTLFYILTGLHSLHVLFGFFIIAYMIRQTKKDIINHSNFAALENAGVYWHIINIVWLFLFPLLYLIA